MDANTFRLSTTQIAAVSESLVAATLTVESAGQLSVFDPFADDHGIDLIALDKASGRSVRLQVKAWTTTAEADLRTPQFDVRKATFLPAPASLLLAIQLQLSPLALRRSWLMPMADIPAISTQTETKYALRPSTRDMTRDRYRPYRHDDPADLTSAVLTAINDR